MVKSSLVEAYDDRDVIRQISKLTDEVKADTEVITEKASAIDTALPKVEKAVEDAEDASTQAQAAAAVAQGLGDRVTAVENSAAQNHSDITVLDGEVTDINNDLTNVVRKVTTDVQKVNKGLRVGEVPAGDDVVIDRATLDAYPHVVRTTGEQVVNGLKMMQQLPPSVSPKGSTGVTYGLINLGKATKTGTIILNLIFSGRYDFAFVRVTVTPVTHTTDKTFEKLDVTTSSAYTIGLGIDDNGDLWLSQRKTASAGQVLFMHILSAFESNRAFTPSVVTEDVILTDSPYTELGRV